eukprot:scaffold37665_cov2989-Isochrysis_galbana.AAC.1
MPKLTESSTPTPYSPPPSPPRPSRCGINTPSPLPTSSPSSSDRSPPHNALPASRPTCARSLWGSASYA